jgi:hypothetical protein
MIGFIGSVLAGCAANPATTGYDQYGNPINANDPYGSSYSAMGGATDTSYDSSYDTGYDSTSGGGYDSTGSDSYGDGAYGASPSPSPSASPTPAGSLDDRPVLSATLLEVKESGVLGMGKITAKVLVENPGNITLTGKLRVLFTDNGDPTPNAIIRVVTLHPAEKQTLTFTAKAWRLDDAEVSIDTDPVSQGKSRVVD